MNTQHTPGPWRMDALMNVMAAGGLVAFPGISAGFDQEANARLIAAAPDLLAACLKLAEWDQREKDHAIDFRARVSLCDEAFTLMGAAIAKATGEQA